MENRLLKIAIYTSPIIALYGVAPLFLFKKVDLQLASKVLFALTILIFVFWLCNIYLNKKIKSLPPRLVISYVTTFIIQIVFINIGLFLKMETPKGANNIFYSIISTFAINSIILVLLNMQKIKIDKVKAENEVKILKISNLEAQKHMLTQQLQPHFLFNSLSVLKSLITENQNAAENYTQKLSDFLRYSILSNSQEVVNFEEELQFTKDYIALQKMRFGEAIKVTFEINKDNSTKKIPFFALQTLVENAIKHNSFTEKKPLQINILNIENEVIIANNRFIKKQSKPLGTGLKNLNERYFIIAQKNIKIVENETEFQVKIPLL